MHTNVKNKHTPMLNFLRYLLYKTKFIINIYLKITINLHYYYKLSLTIHSRLYVYYLTQISFTNFHIYDKLTYVLLTIKAAVYNYLKTTINLH